MIKKTITHVTFAMLLTLTASANASCLQADIAGVWHSFASSSTARAVGHCVFRFASNGAVFSSSVCNGYTATANIPPVNIKSGAFKVNAACNIAGSIVGSNGITAWFKGQMDKSKSSIAGISRNSTGSITLHNFIKQ